MCDFWKNRSMFCFQADIKYKHHWLCFCPKIAPYLYRNLIFIIEKNIIKFSHRTIGTTFIGWSLGLIKRKIEGSEFCTRQLLRLRRYFLSISCFYREIRLVIGFSHNQQESISTPSNQVTKRVASSHEFILGNWLLYIERFTCDND